MNRVDEIRNVNYVPNNDDILQSRRRTSDIQKLEFQVKLPVKSGSSIRQTFCMFDVGGQKGERRKWIQVFDGVSAVMFLIDSSSFDAVDDENGRNKLRETINLFYEVWTTRFLLNSNFVLLFNKQDILKEKIQRGHKIEDHFPEYKHYKCQPQDRALLSRAGEKLNLFRSTSRTSSRGSSNSTRSSIGANISNINIGENTTSNQKNGSGSLRDKRKSSSLYRIGLSRNNRPAKPTVSSQSVPSTPILSTPLNFQNLKERSDTKTSPLPPFTNLPASSDSSIPTTTPAQRTTSTKTTNIISSQQQIADHQAYIKARSFIRDKFLQITRQVDSDQRKFSAPNLMYNASVGHVDQPKRNVCYHYTTATDTENIRDLFDNLQKMVIKSTMKDLR